MSRLFNAENPVWKFIGNLADFFFLSVLWAVCCLPVFTIGAATTALYYVTLKMASNQEGKLTESFFRSFRQNFRQATGIWMCSLAIGALIAFDLLWGLRSGTSFGMAMFISMCAAAVLFLMCLSFVFVLLARISNTAWAVVRMACAMTVRNFLPVLSALAVSAAFAAVGLFAAWPVLLIAPGLAAYLNSFLYNHILNKYGFQLRDGDPTPEAPEK